MILPEHFKHHERLKKYCTPQMLMLGNQENNNGYDFGCEYITLDPDGGDITGDLNVKYDGDLRYQTVYNLGTVEHVWNVQQAFENAANMTAVGGHYLHHGPCGGYENHGIHVTDWKMTMDFFKLNGFEIVEFWFSDQDGEERGYPSRGGRDTILWFVAKKLKQVDEFVCPQQVFKNGVKL